MQLKRYLNPVEASEYIGVSSSWLAKLRLYGGGPRYSKIGRSIRYATEELDAWLASNLQVSTSEFASSRTKGSETSDPVHRTR
jgi:predicted DNA-binding transcriptional regulator AlpA